MKLLLKILLTILSFLLLLGLLWLSLPHLLVELAENQLLRAGFSNIEVKIGDIDMQTVTVERLEMSNAELDIVIEGLQARYHLPQLLSGELISIQAENIVLNRLPVADDDTALPDPVVLSGLLVLPWQQYMPADSMSLENLSLYEVDGTLSLTASAEVSRQEESTQVEIHLTDSNGKKHQLKLTASPGSGIDMQWQAFDSEIENPVSVQIYPINNGTGLGGTASIDLSGIKGLVTKLDDLSGQMEAKFSYLRKTDNADNNISLNATITDADIAGIRAKAITVDMQASLIEKDDSFKLQFEQPSTIKIEALQQGKNKVAKAVLKFPRTLGFVEGQPVLNRENGAEISLRNTVLDNILIPDLQINEIAISARQTKAGPVDCRFKMRLIAPVMHVGDVQFQASPFMLKGVCPGGESLQWSVTADSDSVAIENDDFILPLTECHISAESEKDGGFSAITGTATCRSNNQNSQVSIHYRINPDAGSGHAGYSFDGIKPDSDKPLFSSLLKNWQQPFDIVSGTHSIRGRYSWWKSSKGRDSEKLTMELNIDDAGGFYEGILFSGLNYKDHIELLPDIKSSEFSEISVRNVDVGIPITSVRAEILLMVSANGPLPLIKVNGLSMSLLDGTVKGNDLEIDMNADRHDMILVVDGLDLAQIVALQQVDGLSATGRLDGYIPVTVTNNGIRITKGKIVAQQQGGVINYRPEGGTAEIEKSAVGSEFVFRIIEDLNYDSLNIDIDYDEDGEMEMKLAIKGMSPKVDAQRPVHFNLNLQQNVLKLLQALRYAEDLSEDIDRNIQKRFRK